MGPSIAIVGAGPAGLTLARILQVSDISLSITIFERDTSPTSRQYQGGTLDLHNETGLAALKKAGLWDEFQKHARYDAEELVIADKNGTQLIHMTEDNLAEGFDARPEIDREKLKEMLLQSVNAEWIKWGKQLTSVDAEGRLLTFKDGSTEGPFDLVVGADGAWSKVRPVLTDIRPQYSGICGFESHILKPNEEYPDISTMVGRGSYFAYSDFKGMTVQRMSDESIKVSNWVMREEDYPTRLIKEFNEAKVKEIILSHFSDWLPELQKMVRVSTRFRAWPLYELPVGHRWDHRLGFTMVGDSAHLMTPFAGEGVNAAMRDSLELSEAIIDSLSNRQNDLDGAVSKYEEAMFPRARAVQEDTMSNKTHCFRADAPIGFVLLMMNKLAEGTPPGVTKTIRAWLPLTAIAFCYFWTMTTVGSLKQRVRRYWSR